jgi:hypothetical protein
MMQALRVIARNFESTAMIGTIGGRCCHDHMTAGAEGMSYLLYIVSAVRKFGEEMEDSPVMPDIIPLKG